MQFIYEFWKFHEFEFFRHYAWKFENFETLQKLHETFNFPKVSWNFTTLCIRYFRSSGIN